MKRISSLQPQQGYLTLITIILIVVVGFIAVALAYIMYGSAFATVNLEKSTSALYLAESGLEDAAHKLNAFTLANRSACTGLSLTNTSIGDGAYGVTSTGPFYTSSPTTLDGALTSSATSIPVISTANYQRSGRIMIDQELINYAAVDATDFLYVERGIDGSTATGHAPGTPIGQYQCQLLSIGGAPTLTYASGAPGGKRILNEAIQVQEAWVVGPTTGGLLTLMHWNNPTELSWTNASITGAFTLKDISMISNVDGWAVGSGATFLHWNGSAWATVGSGLSNVIFNDVFCAATNNCHVVGDMVGGTSNLPTLADWNGSTWAATTLNVGTLAGHQQSIHCATPTDCWSVGDVGASAATSHFYHWNGSGWSATLVSGFAAADFPFNSVFCTTSTNCWAIGSSANFAYWNGSTWANIATGMPAAKYNAIYCNNASDCWAVGNVAGGADLIIHWNGIAWSRDGSALTPATNLKGVACAGANDCWAVGSNSGGAPTFVHWDGSSWTMIATTGLPDTPANGISMVSPSSQPWSAWSENFG